MQATSQIAYIDPKNLCDLPAPGLIQVMIIQNQSQTLPSESNLLESKSSDHESIKTKLSETQSPKIEQKLSVDYANKKREDILISYLLMCRHFDSKSNKYRILIPLSPTEKGYGLHCTLRVKPSDSVLNESYFQTIANFVSSSLGIEKNEFDMGKCRVADLTAESDNLYIWFGDLEKLPPRPPNGRKNRKRYFDLEDIAITKSEGVCEVQDFDYGHICRINEQCVCILRKAYQKIKS